MPARAFKEPPRPLGGARDGQCACRFNARFRRRAVGRGAATIGGGGCHASRFDQSRVRGRRVSGIALMGTLTNGPRLSSNGIRMSVTGALGISITSRLRRSHPPESSVPQTGRLSSKYWTRSVGSARVPAEALAHAPSRLVAALGSAPRRNPLPSFHAADHLPTPHLQLLYPALQRRHLRLLLGDHVLQAHYEPRASPHGSSSSSQPRRSPSLHGTTSPLALVPPYPSFRQCPHQLSAVKPCASVLRPDPRWGYSLGRRTAGPWC